jgi:hypothetical protein
MTKVFSSACSNMRAKELVEGVYVGQRTGRLKTVVEENKEIDG